LSFFENWKNYACFQDIISLFGCSQDASNETAAELQGVPDLIIGNYSDGNLVSSLLSYKLGSTQVCCDYRVQCSQMAIKQSIYCQMTFKLNISCAQCTIAHALEKTKHPDSDKYWRKYDKKYHFASQFTADLIAMNSADFIITSTYIPGDCENVSL
jgi:sucrose synthase